MPSTSGAQKGVVSLALGRLGIAHHEFACCSWRQRVLEGLGDVFGKEYRDYVEKVILTEEAASRSQALWRFQDRLMGKRNNEL